MKISKIIELSEQQKSQLDKLAEEIFQAAAKQSQGYCTIQEDFFDRIREIIPEVTAVSANYYDCNGRPGFALKFDVKFTTPNAWDDDSYIGIALAPRGHLTKYLKYRFAIKL
ncbi:MAG TPA: hypothetical protein PLC04_07940 [Candidatus Kapabacteria bacterium]|nr:hypothetical protein [Candidatus Kapabacteria bacterium]